MLRLDNHWIEKDKTQHQLFLIFNTITIDPICGTAQDHGRREVEKSNDPLVTGWRYLERDFSHSFISSFVQLVIIKFLL